MAIGTYPISPISPNVIPGLGTMMPGFGQYDPSQLYMQQLGLNPYGISQQLGGMQQLGVDPYGRQQPYGIGQQFGGQQFGGQQLGGQQFGMPSGISSFGLQQDPRQVYGISPFGLQQDVRPALGISSFNVWQDPRQTYGISPFGMWQDPRQAHVAQLRLGHQDLAQFGHRVAHMLVPIPGGALHLDVVTR